MKLELDESLHTLARERAKAGAAYLDLFAPWWHEGAGGINIAQKRSCALAAVYGDYTRGIDALQLNDEQTLLLGFRGCRHELNNNMSLFPKYYAALSQAWWCELTFRQGSETASLM